MHILVVNDDGPPSNHSSPYVHSLVRELQQAGHLVSVCLPHTQRSWIGKAHIIGQTVEPTYYRPPPLSGGGPPAGIDREDGEPDNAGTVHKRPFRGADASSSPEEWVLVNGTPASCVQIGLYHVFRERTPVDLVVSGPNYGRNTTAVFALSSGTLGGALEAATCGKPAIALSYAFFSKNHDRAIIQEAGRHAARVIEALYRRWPKDGSVDLYSVNVPLVAGVSANKTVYAPILQNYWREGGCFTAAEASSDDDDVEEERIRAGQDGEASERAEAETTTATPHNHGHTTPITHRHFKWQPRFTDIFRSVEEAPPGNDGWAVREGLTSISPLKANFWQAATELQQTEFQLDPPSEEEQQANVDVPIAGLSIADPAVREAASGETEKKEASTAAAATTAAASTSAAGPSHETLYALIAYEDPYVQPIILEALKAVVPEDRLHLLTAAPGATSPTADEPVSLEQLLRGVDITASSPKILQITPYEVIDFAYAAEHASSVVVNSYVIRKALIRKHFLAATVEQWVAKRPDSALAGHVQRTEAFEVDYAEFLDDALVEAFDLRASLAANEDEDKGADARQWWILKPSMSDRGQGIRLFSTTEELQAIFDGWEEDVDGDEDDEDNDDDHNDAVATADLRHFVAQPYIHPPLLLPGTDGRKFHVRVYVLCVGAMRVYVHRDMLALFAAKPYAAPWDKGSNDDDSDDNEVDLAAHLTNTCLQDEADKGDSVRRFWDLEEPAGSGGEGGGRGLKDRIFDQICRVTGALFEAAAVAAPVHFQPLPHAFEVYGLDFLVSNSTSSSTSSSTTTTTSTSTSSPTATTASASPSAASSDVTAWLLEVNAFPDFRQTGTGLQGVVAQFWADTLRLVVRRQIFGQGRDAGGDDTKGGGGEEEEEDLGRLVLVKDVALGRR